MTEKKKKYVVALLGLVIFLLATVTIFAAIYVRFSVKSVITVGNIEVELVELDEKGKAATEEEIHVSRGYFVERSVYAKNTGTHPAFVRISVEGVLKDGTSGEVKETDKVELCFHESEHWIYKDGWYYYDEILEPREKTDILLEGIYFAASLDESNQDDVFQLDIQMHGLQSENNASDVMEAVGWPEE